MKLSRIIPNLSVAMLLWPQASRDQADGDQIEEPSAPMLNRMGLNYTMGLNFKVDFRNLGGLRLSDPGAASGSAVNRNYDNGYNRVDVAGNQGGLTWNWGYRSANSAEPGSLVLQGDRTPVTATTGKYREGGEKGAGFF